MNLDQCVLYHKYIQIGMHTVGKNTRWHSSVHVVVCSKCESLWFTLPWKSERVVVELRSSSSRNILNSRSTYYPFMELSATFCSLPHGCYSFLTGSVPPINSCLQIVLVFKISISEVSVWPFSSDVMLRGWKLGQSYSAVFQVASPIHAENPAITDGWKKLLKVKIWRDIGPYF